MSSVKFNEFSKQNDPFIFPPKNVLKSERVNNKILITIGFLNYEFSFLFENQNTEVKSKKSKL